MVVGSESELLAEKRLRTGGRPAESFQNNLQIRPVRHGGAIYQPFFIDHVEQFQYQPSVAVLEIVKGKPIS